MGVLQKLGRFVVRGSDATKDPAEALRKAFTAASTRFALLELHAQLAPQDYSNRALASLAADTTQQIERIRNELRQRGVGLPAATKVIPQAPSLNHWARLVQDLELHRASTRRLRELAAHFADVDQDVSAFLQELCEENYHSCERLRALIARADPQALD